MRFESLLAPSLWASVVFAFQGTSPFFLFSTSHLQQPSSKQLVSSHQLHADLSNSLSSCPSDVYIVVSQPGVSADDFHGKDVATGLRRRASGGDKNVKSTTVIPEVLGNDLDIASIKAFITRQCSTDSLIADADAGVIPSTHSYPYILELNFPALPASQTQRSSKLAEHGNASVIIVRDVELTASDSFIDAAIHSLDGRSYTLLYHTTPPSPSVYSQLQREEQAPEIDHLRFDWEAEHTSPEALHMDLKRDLSGHNQKRQDPEWQPSPGLFEKYNFLSPGIFMGLVAVFILISIAMVGLNALNSLEVSYAAFSKEMGPGQQKKQQ